MPTPDTIQILNAISSNTAQVINTVLNRIAASDQQLVSVINTGNNLVLQNVSNQLNSVNAQISGRLSAISSQLSQNNNVVIQAITAQLQGVQSSILAVQNTTTQRIIQEIAALLANQSNLQKQLNDRVIDRIQESTQQLNAIVHNSQDTIIAKVQDALLDINITPGGQTGDLRPLVNDIFGGDIIDLGGLLGLLGGTSGIAKNTVNDVVGSIIDSLHEQSDAIKEVVENITSGKYKTLSEMKAAFEQVGTNFSVIDFALAFSQFLPAILKVGSILAAPFFTRLEQAAKAQYGLNQLDANTILALYRKHWLTDEQTTQELKAIGYNDKNVQLLKENAFGIPNPEAIRLLFYRGKMTREKARETVTAIPNTREEVEAFMLSLNQVPTMPDLVSMAVKEAFSPDVATKYGQYEDYPQQLTEFAQNNGFSEEWAKRYWASHWSLPSPQMGFEMFQRGIISKTDLTTLLRSLDIMPYWREKLINLNYSLPTRVDIRRMYGEGLINYQEVHTAYKQLGYDEKWSKLLADFAVRYDDEQEAKKQGHLKDLTYSTVETAYKRKIINRNEAYARLQQLKYIAKDIDLLLNLWDYQEYVRTHPDRVAEEYDKLADLTINAYKRKVIDKAEAVENLTNSGYTKDQANKALAIANLEYEVASKAEIIQLVNKQYLDGMLTNLEVQTTLTSLGFTIPEATEILNKLVVIRKLSVNRPTKAELVNMAKKEIITTEDLRQEFRNMNYDELWIEPLIELAGLGEDI